MTFQFNKYALKTESSLFVYDFSPLEPIEIDADDQENNLLPFKDLKDYLLCKIEWNNVNCFNLDNTYVIASRNEQVKVFNIESQDCCHHLLEEDQVVSVSINSSVNIAICSTFSVLNLWNLKTNEKIKQITIGAYGYFYDDKILVEPIQEGRKLYTMDLNSYQLKTLRFDTNIDSIHQFGNDFIVQYDSNSYERVFPHSNTSISTFITFLQNPLFKDVVCIKDSLFYIVQGSKVCLCLLNPPKQPLNNIPPLMPLLQNRKDFLQLILPIWHSDLSRSHNTLKFRNVIQYLITNIPSLDCLVEFLRMILILKKPWLDLIGAAHCTSLLVLLKSDLLQSTTSSFYKDLLTEFMSVVINNLGDVILSTIEFKDDPIMQLAISSQDRLENCLSIHSNLNILHNVVVWMPCLVEK